jgi:hypothetical protein
MAVQCAVKLVLAQLREDCDELRRERDDWGREAEKLYGL